MTLKIDAPLRNLPLTKTSEEAQRLEALGFDGLWTFETSRDPFLPLLQIALGTHKINLGPNIAVAFARSPFSMAMTAWDIQRASHGRLLLGLGTQVRAHVERRFSMPFEHPAARISDYIDCMRSIWRTFQTGEKPNYHGQYYQFTLINDFFNPGPIDYPNIPIYLAGVNPRMARAAGEVADGFSIHPMHCPAYVRDVIRPALQEGAQIRGRSVEDLVLYADVFIIDGTTESERMHSEEEVRRQIAFYASTPSYRSFLEYHGKLPIAKKLSLLMREGKLADMPYLIDDDLLSAAAISRADGNIACQLKDRYKDNLIQRVMVYKPVEPNNEIYWSGFINTLRAP